VNDDLVRRVREFIARETGLRLERVTLATDVVEDTCIYGIDVEELVVNFSKEFGVDVSNFRWYHHTGPEGCCPLWLFYRPWWARKTRVPITVEALVESARKGVLALSYPEKERED